MKNRQNRNGTMRRFASATLALGIIFSSNMSTAWAEPDDDVNEVNEVREEPKEAPAQETTTTNVTETPVTQTTVTETPVTETTVTETVFTETPVTETVIEQSAGTVQETVTAASTTETANTVTTTETVTETVTQQKEEQKKETVSETAEKEEASEPAQASLKSVRKAAKEEEEAQIVSWYINNAPTAVGLDANGNCELPDTTEKLNFTLVDSKGNEKVVQAENVEREVTVDRNEDGKMHAGLNVITEAFSGGNLPAGATISHNIYTFLTGNYYDKDDTSAAMKSMDYVTIGYNYHTDDAQEAEDLAEAWSGGNEAYKEYYFNYLYSPYDSTAKQTYDVTAWKETEFEGYELDSVRDSSGNDVTDLLKGTYKDLIKRLDFFFWYKKKAAPAPDPEPSPDPKPEPTPDPTPEPTPDPEPDPRPEPTPDPTPIIIPIPDINEPLPEPEPVTPVITPAAPVNQPAVTEAVYEVIEDDIAPAAAPVNNEPAGKPTEVVELADEVLPLVQPVKYWALINLICAAVTTLFGLGMLVSFLKKRDNDEDEEIETEESEEEKKRMKSKLLGLLPAVGSIVLFLLTEDMHNRMRLFDKWTIWMIALALVNAALAYLTRNREEDESDENRTEEANA